MPSTRCSSVSLSYVARRVTEKKHHWTFHKSCRKDGTEFTCKCIWYTLWRSPFTVPKDDSWCFVYCCNQIYLYPEIPILCTPLSMLAIFRKLEGGGSGICVHLQVESFGRWGADTHCPSLLLFLLLLCFLFTLASCLWTAAGERWEILNGVSVFLC